MGYIITAIFAFVGSYILWQIKREKLSLVYGITESENFPREKGKGKYFVIKFKNSGNKAIENIDLKIEFESAVIETISFSDKSNIKALKKSNHVAKGIINLLNPKDIFGITITTFSKEEMGAPEIVARAIGVTAKQKEEIFADEISPFTKLSLVMIFAGLVFGAGILGAFGSKYLLFGKKTDLWESKLFEQKQRTLQGEPQSPEHIFSIFNRFGISYLFPELIEKNGEARYWKTGAFLMHKFIKDKDNRENYINAMKKLVEIEEMASSSLGFNLYLLAKMEQHIGNNDRALKYLERCKNEAPLMYDYLIEQDKYYDTKFLEDFFNKKP